jgi:hypothetical protein
LLPVGLGQRAAGGRYARHNRTRNAREATMATYRMSDGTVVKTENAVQSWTEGTRWNGNNHVSLATGDQFLHQKLHRSRKGRYWVECWSQWQGSTPHAEWLSPQEAARWLLANECEPGDMPDDLGPLEPEVSE